MIATRTNLLRRVVTLVLGGIMLGTVTAAVSQTVQAPEAQAASCVSLTYRQGSSGTCVRYIQILVNYKKSPTQPLLTVDGAFGPLTRAGVVSFQSYWGLTADGIVGKNTWRALCSAQMGYTDAAGVSHGVWLSRTALDAARWAGCNVANDVMAPGL